MKVLFLRHGQTQVNTAGGMHSKNDEASLNSEGRDQARKLVPVCREAEIKALYCSPELRAEETARVIAEQLALEPVTLASLSERDWGEWAGMPWQDIQAKLRGMSLEERYRFIPPQGESWQQVEARLNHALEVITRRAAGNAAVVTHGGALRALMPLLKEQPKETSFQYDFDNASVTSFEYIEGQWKLLSENSISHLS